MLKNESGSASKPIAQCLSADQHTRKIRYFLERFVDDFGVPNEVTIDDSAALIKSVVTALTKSGSPKNYIRQCLQILHGNLSESVECYIRLDVAHFVKNVVRNKVFAKMLAKQKMFYQSLIGALMRCETFALITEIVEKILLVATIPFESEDFPTYDSLRFLKKLIKTHDMTSFVEAIERMPVDRKLEDSIELMEDPDDSFDDQLDWFMRIEKKVGDIYGDMPNNSSSELRENYYYCAEFIPYFKKLCARIVLWTPAMNSYFKSNEITTSSSDVENQNNIIKNTIFRDTKLPIRLDTFMNVYLKAIKGDLFMASSAQTFHHTNEVKQKNCTNAPSLTISAQYKTASIPML